MGKRIYFEDAASIALLYNYKVTKRNMLSLNRVKEFDAAIDKKLDEMNSNVQCVYPLDCSKLIYFYTQDENDKEYLILKHDFDYEKAEHDLLQFPLDIYKAIRDNEVLNVLDIEMVDGEFQKIEKSNNITELSKLDHEVITKIIELQGLILDCKQKSLSIEKMIVFLKNVMNYGEFQMWLLDNQINGVKLSTNDKLKKFLSETSPDEILSLYDIEQNYDSRNLENIGKQIKNGPVFSKKK